MNNTLNDLSALSIEEFLLLYPVTLRLLNAIARADEKGNNPFKTVGDYANVRNGYLQLMKIEGIGFKAAREFDALIENVINKKNVQNRNNESELLSNEIKLSEFVQKVPVSVKIRNAIIDAEENGGLSLITIRDYIEAKNTAVNTIQSINNMGLNSAKELDAAINAYCNNTRDMFYETSGSVNLDVSLEDFVNINPVSIRIRNAIVAAAEKNILNIKSIRSYIRNPAKSNIELSKIDNLGSKSITELEKIIKDYCCNDTKQKQNWSVNIHHDINDIVESIISKKELSILKARSISSKTLEEVGVKFGVTRERIRQIEKKSIRKLSMQLKLPLEDFSKKLDLDLDDAYGEIGLGDVLEKYHTSVLEFKFLVYISSAFFKEKVSIKNKLVYRVSNISYFPEWNNIIDDCLYSAYWPVNLEDLKKELVDIPETYLTQHLFKKRKATLENGVITKLEKISQEARITYVLRAAGKSLSVSEIVNLYKSMFELEINEHNACSIVGRMDNALIVNRGIYALYETFGLTDELADFVRHKSLQYLIRKNMFISSKVIYEDVFQFNDEFKIINNEYVLHGVLQDDDRFVIKRGLMVGLLEYSGEVDHVPLTNEIHALVEEKGPISVTEIKDLLSRHRKVLSVTVSMMLEKYPDVVKIFPGQYATIEYVFQSEESFGNFLIAIKITLINKKLTLYHLVTLLRSIECFDELEITKSLVASSINKIANVTKEGEIYSLNEIDDQLDAYNRSINDFLSDGVPVDVIKNKMKGMHGYINEDYRLIKSNDIKIESENNEMSSILQAFGI